MSRKIGGYLAAIPRDICGVIDDYLATPLIFHGKYDSRAEFARGLLVIAEDGQPLHIDTMSHHWAKARGCIPVDCTTYLHSQWGCGSMRDIFGIHRWEVPEYYNVPDGTYIVLSTNMHIYGSGKIYTGINLQHAKWRDRVTIVDGRCTGVSPHTMSLDAQYTVVNRELTIDEHRYRLPYDVNDVHVCGNYVVFNHDRAMYVYKRSHNQTLTGT